MTSHADTHFPLENKTDPAAVISDGKIIHCNDLFLQLINCPQSDVIGYELKTFLAVFVEDDGERASSPLTLDEAPSSQVVFLKPRQHLPTCVEVNLKKATHDGHTYLIAVFTHLSPKDFHSQREEIDAFNIAARLWHMSIWDHDHIKNNINISPIMREIYGVDTEDAFTFEQAGQFIHPDDVNMEAVLKAHDPAGDGVFDMGFRIIRPSGEIRWVHSRSQTFFGEEDGQRRPVRTSGAIVDFTDEYRLRLALQEQRQKLADILNSLPSMLMVVDKQGHITQWNGVAETVTGILASDIQHQKLEVACPMVHSEMERIHDAIQQQIPLILTRVSYVHNDDTFFYNVCVTPLQNSLQSEVVVRIDDVSEQVRIEQMLVQSEKLLSVGGLAAGMAHEINNPLAAIIQNVQVIISRLNPELRSNREAAHKNSIEMDNLRGYLTDRKILKMVDSIGEAGTRAASIVNNMLGFVRVSNNKKVDCNIPGLIDTTLDLAINDYDLKKKYDFRKIQITRVYESRDVHVFCDAGKIQQVLLNLIRNAGQALFDAGTAAPKISINVEKGTEFTRIEFEDNGPGIPAEVARRIFEPFFTTKPPGEGTGLGLSISYSIITKEHFGKMHVEEGKEGGARFVIELPNEMPQNPQSDSAEPMDGRS
ncbi:MAG: PAS domain-containing protein [Deltaproteobacteria bacterium]|nr:PAS domain-containing protein [Deltaproteobacteria bacterium]